MGKAVKVNDYDIIHKEAVDLLRTVGIHYPYESRLDLFWLKTRLPKLVDNTKTLKLIMIMLDKLVRMRTLGLEPKHKGDKYDAV